MFDLYFKNIPTIISTLLVISMWTYIIRVIQKRKQITCWGRHIAFITLFGLLLCIFVAIRDRYDLSVIAMTENDILGGIFAADSIQSYLCCIGGAVIAYCCLSSLFIRTQRYRQNMFFLLSVVIILKTLIIEVSRIIMM
jgi:hypothetical protein